MKKTSGFKMKNPSMAKMAKQAGSGSPMQLDLGKLKKKVKKFANESTFLNPRSSREMGLDEMDMKMHTRLMKDYRKRGSKNTKEDKAYLDFYKAKTDSISKGLRPNKKNRY